jgi:tetratricopeptide (TPR) repeat protein
MNLQALERREKELGKLHPDTLTSVSNLALVLQDQGKYDEAEKMYRRALEGREKQLGGKHPDTLHSIHSLAFLLHQLKRYKMASELYQRACDGFRSKLGPDHPTTVACLNNYSAMQIEKSLLKSVADEQVDSAPTDSGYASMAHGKSVPAFDTSQTGFDVIAEGLSLPDTNPAVEFKHSIDQEQVIPKFGLYTAPTIYSASETSTLPPPRDETYISQLALDLFSSVKSYESNRNTLERISGKLPDLLRAFALKIGYRAQTPMHQGVSFFVHKHRR